MKQGDRFCGGMERDLGVGKREGREKKGKYKGSKYDIYIYISIQFLMMNVFIVFHKHILVKKKKIIRNQNCFKSVFQLII